MYIITYVYIYICNNIQIYIYIITYIYIIFIIHIYIYYNITLIYTYDSVLHQLYFLPPTITFTICLSPLRSLRMWTSTAVPIDLFASESDAMGFWTPWKHIKEMWKSHVCSSNLRIYDGFSTFFPHLSLQEGEHEK